LATLTANVALDVSLSPGFPDCLLAEADHHRIPPALDWRQYHGGSPITWLHCVSTDTRYSTVHRRPAIIHAQDTLSIGVGRWVKPAAAVAAAAAADDGDGDGGGGDDDDENDKSESRRSLLWWKWQCWIKTKFGLFFVSKERDKAVCR